MTGFHFDQAGDLDPVGPAGPLFGLFAQLTDHAILLDDHLVLIGEALLQVHDAPLHVGQAIGDRFVG